MHAFLEGPARATARTATLYVCRRRWRPICRGNSSSAASAVCDYILLYAATTSCRSVVVVWSVRGAWPRRMRSICATALGVMVTPRQPRLENSRTAQISDSAEVSPGNRPMILVRRRTSTNVRSRRFVERVRLRCASGNRRCAASWSTCCRSSSSPTGTRRGSRRRARAARSSLRRRSRRHRGSASSGP